MRILAVWIMFLMVAAAVAQDDAPASRIQVRGGNRTPEGLECDLTGERFLLSSLAEGTVYAVDYDGAATPFIEDEDLAMSVGLESDAENERLLVVNADSENPQNAFLGIYDLTTGERLQMVDLASLAPDYAHFPNDIALDEDGTAYITDSLAPVIYQVDMDGSASLLLDDERLLIDDFGGNGVVYHPDDYLLVGISGVELYKVPLDEPEDITIVDTRVTVAADGMLWDADAETLLVASDGVILELASEDDWASAEVTATVRSHPATTLAFCGEDVYAIHPEANAIVRVNFPE